MADMKQIHDFAVKWCDKFRNPDTGYEELTGNRPANECDALGFTADYGHSFFQKYGHDAAKYTKLYEIINSVTDIQLLGSAIHSQWKSFAHSTASEIVSFENRAWFALALFRLAALTEDNITAFHGNLKTIRIVSNLHSHSPNIKIVQHIAIDKGGSVYFDGCTSNRYGENYEKARVKNFNIDNASSERLFEILTSRFIGKYSNVFSSDIDNWQLELTDNDDITYKFQGPLNNDFKDLSDSLREILGMESLYLFDGNFKADVINKITLDYTKIEKLTVQNGGKWKLSDITSTEHLIIDRKNGTIEHTLDSGTGCKAFHKYEDAKCVQDLFDRFGNEILFDGTPTHCDNTGKTRSYTITVDYENKPAYTISGSFDKAGLPKGFDYFIKALSKSVKSHNSSDIFNYDKAKRRKSEYIMCSVAFDFGEKKYRYLTDDESIKVGDSVLVPTGDDNIETVATVVEIGDFNVNQIPFSTDKIKHIICKCVRE